MPQKQLLEIEQSITNQLRKNTLIAGVLTLTGFTLLIPAFSVQGTRLDYQEFCYRPPFTKENPYCKGDRIKKGIAWRITLERANNQEFQEKVTLLKYLPAQNPNAGIYGFAAAAFIAGAFCCLRKGTSQLADNLDVVVANKKALTTERTLEQIKHLNLQGLKAQQEEELIRDLMQREHGDAMYSLMGDGERELSAQQYRKAEQLKDAEVELQLAALKAQAAEQAEKEAKHHKEIEKLAKPDKPAKASPELSHNEAARAELIEKLKEHEGGWLFELCTGYKPLWLLGDMGSWKSYCAATIALARYYLEGWKIQSICDPHLHQNRSKSWKELITLEPECYGANQNWEGIDEGLQAALERWAIREEDRDPIITSIWDELTNYSKHPECVNSASEFSGRAVSDPRKAAEGIILIAHAFTNKTTGGSEGYAEARVGNSIQLRLTSTNKMKPTFKGKLTGLKNEEGEVLEELPVTIPKDWFNPEAIRKIFSSQK